MREARYASCHRLSVTRVNYGSETVSFDVRDALQPPQSATRIATIVRSASVGRPNAEPAVANLLVVHARIVGRGRQLEYLRREPADGVQDGVGRDHPVMLGGD